MILQSGRVSIFCKTDERFLLLWCILVHYCHRRVVVMTTWCCSEGLVRLPKWNKPNETAATLQFHPQPNWAPPTIMCQKDLSKPQHSHKMECKRGPMGSEYDYSHGPNLKPTWNHLEPRWLKFTWSWRTNVITSYTSPLAEWTVFTKEKSFGDWSTCNFINQLVQITSANELASSR